ncbi:MAG: tryptophan synthase subunit alpha [Clostridia bacterium]|nr:tryptophan synthase subunit alpha [Clostridia bacterium]
MSRINRLVKCFRGETGAENEKRLITYFMAGDPTYDQSKAVISTAIEAGADIVELGIPFTDPLADGPVIEQAGLRALAQGINLKKAIDLAGEIRSKYSSTPIVVMTYYNPIYKMGLTNFVSQAAQAGVDGLIVPDLPFGEDLELFELCSEHNLELIPLVVVSTSESRLKAIGTRKPAFIYCVSVNGITGVRKTISSSVQELLHRVRTITDRPVGVGFGIGTPAQAQSVAVGCEAVIVGSALVDLVAKHSHQEEMMIEKIAENVMAFKQAILHPYVEVT